MKRICSRIEFKTLLSQDVLFVQDVKSDNAYLVTSGILEYIQHFGSSVLTQNLVDQDPARVQEVSEKKWLSWASLWSHWVHVGKAEAKPVSEVMILSSSALLENIDRCQELREFVNVYSVQFHKRLVSASPSSEWAGVWPSDVEVPLTDYGEIVLGMDQENQKFVATMVLEKLGTHYMLPWRGMSSVRMHELVNEVLAGQCVLVENEEGAAERVVAVTCMRIMRQTGEVLAVLAKRPRDSSGDFEPEGQLPGVKQDPGELPSQAGQRLFREQLRPFARAVNVHNLKREDMHEHSTRYRIKTKYIRVIYFASLDEEMTKHLQLQKVTRTVALKKSSTLFTNVSAKRWTMPPPEECYLLQNSRTFFVCGFVDPDALGFFRRNAGRRLLAHWSKSLDSDACSKD